MDDHSELLKEARELAVELELRENRIASRVMIRKLADILERQDTDLGDAVAACISCVREMSRVLGLYEDKYGIFSDFRAARQRARCAANLA